MVRYSMRLLNQRWNVSITRIASEGKETKKCKLGWERNIRHTKFYNELHDNVASWERREAILVQEHKSFCVVDRCESIDCLGLTQNWPTLKLSKDLVLLCLETPRSEVITFKQLATVLMGYHVRASCQTLLEEFRGLHPNMPCICQMTSNLSRFYKHFLIYLHTKKNWKQH